MSDNSEIVRHIFTEFFMMASNVKDIQFTATLNTEKQKNFIFEKLKAQIFIGGIFDSNNSLIIKTLGD